MTSTKDLEEKQLTIITRLSDEASTIPEKLESEEDALIATDFILKIRKMFTDLDGKRKERTAPANETIRIINEDYKKYLNPLQEVEKKIKKALEEYADNKIQRDLEKLAEIRKKAKNQSLVIPIGLTQIPSAAGDVRFRKKFLVTITDRKKVPKSYWDVNLDAIQKVVDTNDGNVEIEGIEITQISSAAIYVK